MRKAEIENQGYKLTPHGRVTSPGKFEGEPWWIVALWDRALDGFANATTDDGDVTFSHFYVDSDQELAEVSGIATDRPREILVWEDENGFVRHVVRARV